MKLTIDQLYQITSRLADSDFHEESLAITDAQFMSLFSMFVRHAAADPDTPQFDYGFDPDEHHVLKHPARIAPLTVVRSRHAALDFAERIPESMILEECINGIDAVVTYRNGDLFSIASVGDGYVGENWTRNWRLIRNLPLKLLGPHLSVSLLGTIYATNADFLAANEKIKTPIKRPRELARRFMMEYPDSSVDGSLLFKAREIVGNPLNHEFDIGIYNHDTFHRAFPAWGVDTVENRFVLHSGRFLFNLDELKNAIKDVDYGVNGFELKVDDYEIRNTLRDRWGVRYSQITCYDKFKSLEAL